MDVIIGILLIAVAVGTAVLCIALAGFTRRMVQQNIARSAPADDSLGAGVHAWNDEPPAPAPTERTDTAANG
jgi:hypothetical protein